MPNICFYFQIHQPFRIKNNTVFDIGTIKNYFDDEKNISIMKKVAEKCYIPATKLLIDLAKEYSDFKISFSISGTALEQFEKYSPESLELLKELHNTGKMEILAETYYHSLSFLYSKNEFVRQIKMHTKKIQEIFNVTPKVFRNTELIYNNSLADYSHELGFIGIITEGTEKILQSRSPNYLYSSTHGNNIKLLLKNYKLSDDIAFRFQDKNWSEYPLSADKFSKWIKNSDGNIINLFMDYETFGEHQWKESGIFDFMKNLPKYAKNNNISFITPSEAILNNASSDFIDVPFTISWADSERDTSAWLGNKMQNSAVTALYNLEPHIINSNDSELLDRWRKLQTSDHFYYMCTKWFNDGDVHKYFNPHDSPYEAYIAFMNLIEDFKIKIKGDTI